jgi:hypothetical protein
MKLHPFKKSSTQINRKPLITPLEVIESKEEAESEEKESVILSPCS